MRHRPRIGHPAPNTSVLPLPYRNSTALYLPKMTPETRLDSVPPVLKTTPAEALVMVPATFL